MASSPFAVERQRAAEKRTDELRVVSIESLLSLVELMSEYDISHNDILAIIKPSGPSIDPIAEMITRLVAEKSGTEEMEKPPERTQEGAEEARAKAW